VYSATPLRRFLPPFHYPSSVIHLPPYGGCSHSFPRPLPPDTSKPSGNQCCGADSIHIMPAYHPHSAHNLDVSSGHTSRISRPALFYSSEAGSYLSRLKNVTQLLKGAWPWWRRLINCIGCVRSREIEKLNCILSKRATRPIYIRVQVRLNNISSDQSQQSSPAIRDITISGHTRHDRLRPYKHCLRPHDTHLRLRPVYAIGCGTD
jgi:hypothetical protein